MINTVNMQGVILRVDVNSSKSPKKGPAAIVMIQYGPEREATDQAVQFINLALIRIPPFVYEKCSNLLKKGQVIDITGHVQGVYKSQPMSEGYMGVELVADRVQNASPWANASPADDAESGAEPA